MLKQNIQELQNTVKSHIQQYSTLKQNFEGQIEKIDQMREQIDILEEQRAHDVDLLKS